MNQKIKQQVQMLYKDRRFRIVAPVILGAIILIVLVLVLTPKLPTPQNTVSAYDKLPKANAQSMGSMKGMQMSNQLSINATFGPTSIQLTNTGTNDLHKCTLAVNSGMVQSGYTLQKAVLPANTPVTVQYTDLMHYGLHFDTTKLKAHDLVVMCNDGNNSGWKYLTNR